MHKYDSIFGTLTWNEPCWVSQPIAAPVFGGAEVTIQIFPEQEDELAPIREDRFAALQRFFALHLGRRLDIVPHLWAYYCEVRDSVEPAPPLIARPGDVWGHISPRFVSPERGEDGLIYVSIEAECDWEEEHGLQLVLQNGDRWVKVSACDGHLTDGHAYAKSVLDAWMSDPAATLPVRTLRDINAIPHDSGFGPPILPSPSQRELRRLRRMIHRVRRMLGWK